MKTLNFLWIGIVCLSTFGCASKFIVKTDPLQADLFFKVPNTDEKKPLGQTPYDVKSQDLLKVLGSDFNNAEFFTLVIEKKGFKSQSYTVPLNGFGVLVKELNLKLEEGETEQELRLAKDVLDKMFLAQRFANINQFERALIELDKILAQFPDFARALSMKGSIYFAQKNYLESLKWYEQALKADPQMDETIKLAGKVRQLLGNRAPASNLPVRGSR